MRAVLRWGQSAYETDEDMAFEEAHAHGLGLSWALRPDPRTPPRTRADALVVTSKVSVTDEVLEQVRPSLVLTTTSGFEHIDVEACVARGIIAARCPMARRDAVVEHTIEALIRLLRRLPDQEAPAATGRWARADLPHLAPRGLSGSVVVVVGLGVIGGRLAELLQALGARVIGVDPVEHPASVEVLPLAEAVRHADAVTLHASATPSAIGLLDRPRLRSLPHGCVVVNTARGDLMDPVAAAGLVRAGHLGGLACDVFPTEPWPHLRDEAGPNVLLTPHSSGYTHDLGRRVADDVRTALEAWVSGREVPWRVG
jgi:phosphoglycerate dehydrogenase-like enzyme